MCFTNKVIIILCTTRMHATVFHMRDTVHMCMHVKQRVEEKASDGELVHLFVAQCFSLTGRGSGIRVTAEADGQD